MIIDGWVNLPRMTAEDMARNPALQQVSRFFGDSDSLRTRSDRELLESMDTAGVHGGILAVGLNADRGGRLGLVVPTVNEGLAAVEASAGRLRLMVSVGPLHDVVSTCRQLRELRERPEVAACLVGAAGLGMYLTDRRLYPVYATCVELNLPLVCNVGIFGPPLPSKYQHPLLLEEVCADFPELTVVAAHMGHPWEQLLVRLMMKFPRLYLMTSAYLPTYIDDAVTRFMSSRRGGGRVIFGSDWPMLDLQRAVTEARKLDVPSEELNGYLGGNLADVLGWMPPGT